MNLLNGKWYEERQAGVRKHGKAASGKRKSLLGEFCQDQLKNKEGHQKRGEVGSLSEGGKIGIVKSGSQRREEPMTGEEVGSQGWGAAISSVARTNDKLDCKARI